MFFQLKNDAGQGSTKPKDLFMTWMRSVTTSRQPVFWDLLGDCSWVAANIPWFMFPCYVALKKKLGYFFPVKVTNRRRNPTAFQIALFNNCQEWKIPVISQKLLIFHYIMVISWGKIIFRSHIPCWSPWHRTMAFLDPSIVSLRRSQVDSMPVWLRQYLESLESLETPVVMRKIREPNPVIQPGKIYGDFCWFFDD